MTTSIELICLGFSHKNSPVELREQLTCPLDELRLLVSHSEESLRTNGYHSHANIIEILLLSTCNRWEIYAVVRDSLDEARDLVFSVLAEAHSMEVSRLIKSAYVLTGWEAVEHIHHVACGLDSQVLGEAQVLKQVSSAYHDAVELGSVGPVLSTVFESAIRAGKRARNETVIGCYPCSISSVALASARSVIGDLADRHILVIGLGEMGKLALKSLQARSAANVGLVNRTFKRAQLVAEQTGYRVWPWEDLTEALIWADVVITATSSGQPVLSTAMIKQVTIQRDDRPLVIVDIAVPRDVDAGVGELQDVILFDIDDLKVTLDHNLEARRQAVPSVESIISQEELRLETQLNELAIRPLISGLRQKAEAIRTRELARTLKYLGDADPATIEHIQHLSRSLVNKLLHEPTLRLREKANEGEADDYIVTVRDLFGLEV